MKENSNLVQKPVCVYKKNMTNNINVDLQIVEANKKP